MKKLLFFIAACLVVAFSSLGFAMDTPFRPDRVSYTVKVQSGCVPFTTKFQPMVSGGEGTFYWDWDGDGTWDETSSGAVSHTFSEIGTYKVKLKFVEDDKTYVAPTEETITVTDNFVGDTSSCSGESENVDWHSAQSLSVGDKITAIVKSDSYNFYKIKYIERGDYVIKVWGASASTLNLGLRVGLYDRHTRVIAYSGDSSHFGYLVANLSADFYYVQIYNPTDSGICYTISLEKWDNTYPSGTHKNFPSKATVYRIHEPEKGVNATQYIGIIKQDGAYKFQINSPVFEEKVDCYVAFVLDNKIWFITKVDNNGVGYSTDITKFSENSYSPTNGITVDGFIIPEDLIKGKTLSGYLLVVQTGIDLYEVDWDNDAYLLQWFTITLE